MVTPMIDFILKIIGAWCDPSEAMPVPTAPRKERRQSEPIPANITFDGKGKPFLTTKTVDGFESEVVTIGRVAQRTNGDDFIMAQNPSLKPDKYFRLKSFWAKGLSAKQVAMSIRGERGFGARTLDMYWAAFTEAQKFNIEGRGSTTPLPF